MVMIEAMACGTPVLAFRHGSVSEIVDQGVTGASLTLWTRRCSCSPSDRARSTRRSATVRATVFLRAHGQDLWVYRSLLERPSIGRETTVPMPDWYWKKSRMDMGRIVIQVAGLPKRVTFSSGCGELFGRPSRGLRLELRQGRDNRGRRSSCIGVSLGFVGAIAIVFAASN